jgi:hypothetical protein
MEKYSQFICSNTKKLELVNLECEHTVPVHVKDNEPTISQVNFISYVLSIAIKCFGEASTPLIRASHPIKGRIPEARDKPAKDLLPHETTLHYERVAWMSYFPSVTAKIGNEELQLAVGGIKAYNLDNLYSTKDTLEHFKVFVGFKNLVCTNLCIATDGCLSDLKVNNVDYLLERVNELFTQFSFKRTIDQFKSMKTAALSEASFAHLLGRVKLYNAMPNKLKMGIPDMGLTDSQLSAVATDYFKDKSHARDENGNISIWNMYNLFTGANKNSYIDTFLDRNVKVFEGARHIQSVIENKTDSWYLN